jgi:hypothetical protein
MKVFNFIKKIKSKPNGSFKNQELTNISTCIDKQWYCNGSGHILMQKFNMKSKVLYDPPCHPSCTYLMNLYM